MSRACDICGKKVASGRQYTRRGLPKKVGGIGLRITGKTLRRFKPNVQSIRVQDANGTVTTKRVCVQCLRKGLENSGLVKAPRRQHALYLEEKSKQEEATSTG